jgi:hypothetical protein
LENLIQFNSKIMFKYKNIVLIIIALTVNFGFAQYTDVINSNRPGESMSGFSLGQSVFQTEFGVYYLKEKHDLLQQNISGFGTDLAVRYGFYSDRLEAIANFQIQKDKYKDPYDTINRFGIKKMLFGAKYLLYDPYKNMEEKVNIHSWQKTNKFKWRDYIPAISVYAGTNITLPNNRFNEYIEPVFAPKAMLITQNQFPGSNVLIMNFFADKIASPFMNFGYVITYTKGLNDYWSVFLENKAIIKSEYYTDGIFTAGAAHLLDKNLQVDVSISKNYKDTPSLLYGGIGVSWRFDDNYKETLLRDTKLSKEQEKLEKKQKAAEKKAQKEQDKNVKKADKTASKADKALKKSQPKPEKIKKEKKKK